MVFWEIYIYVKGANTDWFSLESPFSSLKNKNKTKRDPKIDNKQAGYHEGSMDFK